MRRQLAHVVLLLLAALAGPPPAAWAGACGERYVVQRGDTLAGIARRCASTVAQLAAVNRLHNPNRILVGQVLTIPDAWPVESAPRIAGLQAMPATFTPGETLTVTWQATGERARLCPEAAGRALEAKCLGVPVSGSTTIRTGDDAASYTGLQLQVWAGAGYATAHVPLTPRCLDGAGWFFPDAPATCPSAPPIQSSAAAERFERGRMLWVQATGAYYIFLDGPARPFRQVFDPLALKPGAARDNRLGLAAPPGLYEPVSGFGLLWREEVYGAEGLRAQLGWAREPEFGYPTQVQCEAGMEAGWSCYLQAPDGAILNFGYRPAAGLAWRGR